MKTKNKSIKFWSMLPVFIIVFVLFADMQAATAIPAQSSLSFHIGPRVHFEDDPKNAIYVSPNGNDNTATGSINAPYKSINAALEAAVPGDTIALRGGVYRQGVNVRIRKPNITIKSAKGEWAIIDLTDCDVGHEEDSGVYFDVDSSGGKLQNVEVKGGFYAVCMETKWDWGQTDRSGACDIVIEDCILHSSKYDVIKIKPNCDNITIRYNEIYNSGTVFGGEEGNAEGIDNVNGDYMVVQNNYIHDICSTAIYAKGGAIGALIENNWIENAKEAGILVGFDTSPEYFDLSANPQYYENIRCVARNNWIIGTGLSGIGIYAAKDAQIYNNTLVNVASGGLYHSAIYFGVTFQDWESYAGRPASVNLSIHNNIISQPSEIVRPMIEIRYANELGGLSALEGNLSMSHNCYYADGKKAVFSDRRPGYEMENAGLSEWQSHINGDYGSIEADPALGGDYIPTNPSCFGMGASSETFFHGMHNFIKKREYKPGQYTDVNEDAWYGFNRQLAIARVYMYGLMEGNSSKTFNPDGDLTIAEAVAIAARIRNIYDGKNVEFAQGDPWYQNYVDYAQKNGIIQSSDFVNYEKAATRAELANIFSNSLPADEYTTQNTVNSLPDINEKTPFREAIFILYKAGVLAGNDGSGTFSPDKNITRAETAAIISRMILPLTRFSGFTFG
ncbi:MAG: S-layer homology domain-containing protein [Oscillospiraceae bacterium]|nr:S-layer homology domain-containing protein [Oscillospiraceae bacterium]